jgi:prophage tail gpP-like protein
VKDFNKNNIKDSNISMDWSQRYYKYIIRSNGNLSEFDWDTNVTSNVNFKGVAYDNEIRQTRTFEKIAQHILSNTECQKMAVEESNIRRAKSLTYQATVAGYSANGELWQEGKLVSVKDDKKKIYGNFVIKSVHYLYSTAGEITTMDMTYPDAFQLEDSLSDSNQRVVNIGSYTVSKGDTLHDIAKSKNISLQDLISANPQIKNPDLIYPDQTIKIPKGQ